jgi:hypothetical protein
MPPPPGSRHRLKDQTAPKLQLHSCLARSDTPLFCNKRYNPKNRAGLADFKKELQAYLGTLACESPQIAQGLIKQIQRRESDSTRQGLAAVLKKRLADPKCPGLQGLSQEWKDELKALK